MKAYAIYSIHMGNYEIDKYNIYLDPIRADNKRKELSKKTGRCKKLSIIYGVEEIEVIE